MRDIGNEETDALLENMERKVAKVYRRAARESQEKLRDYLDKFEKADKKALADVKAGKMTEEAYKKWRKDEMLKGKRWEEMLNTLAEDYVNADKIAMSIVNGYTPEAYAINRNFAAFEVEKGALIDTSFTLYNRQTVERLLREHKDMLPKPRVDIPKDRRWNKRHIRAEITQGVLQGESIPKVAKRLQKVVGMDHSAAVRNARTAITGAQNAGRMDQYQAAHDKGIDMMQKWVATLDHRTRDSHAALDGELINVGGTFSNGLRFPGDPLGEPSEVYNCRCRMVGHLIGYSFSNDDVERDNRLGSMSYEEWKSNHTKKRQPEEKTLDESYTGRDGAKKFNEYMLKNHPNIAGDMDYVDGDIKNTYNRRFRLQKSMYEDYGDEEIKKVDMKEYMSMDFRQRPYAFPTYESYRDYMLSNELQDFAQPGSIMDGLRRYNLGATPDGYGKGKGARLAFDSEYKLSEFISSNTDVHYNGGTLYRGVKSSKAGIKELEKAMKSGDSIDMRGISSWSTSKHVADEFTELSLRGTKTSTPVVFIEEGKHTRNAMPFPYSSQRGLLIQNEVVYSGDAKFTVLKMEEVDGHWNVYVREI